ncbi:60S ribosomal protein L27 [Schistosoma japonicum]|uniref:Large ribosomal subunit protein eL27 n=3 Tax=Schistosoma japonicum TaxID=6182 RepID=C1LRS5_SCHJA|nr:60S ribosomal protein L27 [Schistosoma japonicum]CAX71543.1 ribosomal protein L27 [Schistosoma japonicum]CAX71544.1 ribosomal protein L27 [Schistosoma japonicum]CAX71545.1 ribosomal protein L27 [Schistosoma japonicum]CAX77398.1 ribosomal protein L27 [Schistosoma japonicum]
MSRDGKTAVRLMRPGVVVLVLAGRYAGRKAIVIKSYDEGSGDKPYGHALVVGIDRYPRRILKRMGKKRMESRCKIKPFVKVVNYNHLMPTRHSVNIVFDTKVINKNALGDKSLRKKAKLEAKLKLQQRYKSNENPWFFHKLRF